MSMPRADTEYRLANQGKYFGSIGSVAALIVVFFGLYFGPVGLRLYRVVHLYDEDRIVENFLNMRNVFPVRNVKAPERTFQFRRSEIQLPETFIRDGVAHDTRKYLDDTKSTDRKSTR
ncbi:MAG: hypothetical protein VCE43_23015, partial [Myxococcota bacterium]